MSLKALATLAMIAPLVGCAALDGSRLPDSERLTVDGPVASEPVPSAAPAAAPPPPPVSVECRVAAVDEPANRTEDCPWDAIGPTADEDLARVAATRQGRAEVIAALSRHPPERTGRLFAVLTTMHLYTLEDQRARVPSVESVLDMLAADAPRWRAGVTALAEEANCESAEELVRYAGRMWAASPELRPGALYLATRLVHRCNVAVGTRGYGDTRDLLARFGAPFAPALLGRLLDEFPAAFACLDLLWPAFTDHGPAGRSAVVNARVGALVSRAHGATRGHRSFLRRAVSAYIDVLERAHDERGLSSLRGILRQSARDPEVDVIVGDAVDELDRQTRAHRQ